MEKCFYSSHCSWSAVKEKRSQKGRGEGTPCLYECLQALGLQHHYASFTSMGVCRVAHLLALKMEDYPLLGIHTMEDRTRLFHLVQMVKTNLKSRMCEDDDDSDDEGCAAVSSSYSYGRHPDGDVCVDLDEDKHGSSANVNNMAAAGFDAPPYKSFDFRCETTDLHQRLFTSPEGPVPKYAGHNRERISLRSSHTGLSIKCDSLHEQTPRPATAKSFNNKPVGSKHRKRISGPCEERANAGASLHALKPTPVYESARTAGYGDGLPHGSPAAIKRRAADQRISVCVRKRPLMRVESRRREADVVTTPGGNCVIIHESKEAVDLTQYILRHSFYFDQVFGEESSNEDVYERTAYPLVQHMLSGGKATCFAYGQTGAGKTHTMLGSCPMSPGLYVLAVRDIFAHLSTAHTRSPLLVYVSFFEIYCGHLYDLLDHRKRLFAREDGQKVVHIAGLHEVRVDSVSSLLQVISQGLGERTQGVSGVNPLSSRSHALLQIQLKCENQQIAGRMWFVDLAGSERASDNKEPNRQSRMEGAEINQSLLALKECIRSLDQEQSHTPFRQSKLTQVLKDSFVGNSMTCMIANISPGHLAAEHTLNTLRYADRVKELKKQGEVRGGGMGKAVPCPRRSSSNSSNSTRCKSPPKKAKLWQTETPGPPPRTTSLPMAEAILCSTPKTSRWGQEASQRGSEGVGLEHITPVRGWVGRADERERVKTEVRQRADLLRCPKGRTELELGRPSQGNSSTAQREFGFSHRETVKVGREEETKWIEPQKQGNSRSMCREAETQNERVWKYTDKKDKEKQRHLRWYHQQLQQFIPTPASSASPSSSNHTSLSSVPPRVCSFLQQPSGRSLSALMDHGLEEVVEEYSNQPEPSSHITNKNEDAHGDLDSVDKDWRLLWAQTKAKFGQHMGESEESRSVKARSEARAKQERGRTVGMEGGEKRWAWVATTGIQHAQRMTGPLETPHQRAPAERPFSPACEHTNTHAAPSLQLRPIGCTSNISHREKKQGFATNPNIRHFPTAHSSTQPPNTSTGACSLSCVMDPLSISLLQVDQQVATASFLQGEQTSASVCLQKNDRGEDNARKVVVGNPLCSDRLGNVVDNEAPHTRVSNQGDTEKAPHQVAEAPVPSLSRLTYASMQASVRQPIKPSVQDTRNTDSCNARSLTHDRYREPASSNSTQLSESASIASSQCDTPPSRHVRDNSLKMNSPTGSNGRGSIDSQQIRPMIRLSTLENMNHAQWCVVRAHWEQLEEMEALCHTEGMLLCQQPDMEFREYVYKLEKIMDRKAQCVHSMRAQLQPYLNPNPSSQSHGQGEHLVL